ncbi:hypothetical protein FB45DRAFT_795346 [Roridomyces roridus]|uniref:Uncharacterized protein n=1 Tax=Roridomyces roridus TaxID=1738132 RepID=A0AAD7BPR7_9AGAR|nr:hypothetical protein FB45DRAFT_795346 [Roridomyces roridus]
MAPPASSPSPTTLVTIEPDSNETDDPPPPYPSRARRSRRLNPTRRQQPHTDTQAESHLEPNLSSYLETVESEATETTPFLPLSEQHQQHHGSGRRAAQGRPRSDSHPSIMSAVSVAPSLAQTIVSMFQEYEYDEDGFLVQDDPEDGLGFSSGDLPETLGGHPRFWSGPGLKRYFRPLTRKVYWKALFHLYVVNFPYALAAFLYVFILTVTGTTLLMALPLGALLCFFNLLGARVFARGELALQTKFHTPLAYPMPYPPRPLFTRMRHDSGGVPVPEPSFYKNTYAMFTDVTSYQSLFYFLVIKPSITLLLSVALIVLGVPALVLVLPAPLALRAMRRIGIWQANVAVDGLYLSSR